MERFVREHTDEHECYFIDFVFLVEYNNEMNRRLEKEKKKQQRKKRKLLSSVDVLDSLSKLHVHIMKFNAYVV
jgi:hypothetical protein